MRCLPLRGVVAQVGDLQSTACAEAVLLPVPWPSLAGAEHLGRGMGANTLQLLTLIGKLMLLITVYRGPATDACWHASIR